MARMSSSSGMPRRSIIISTWFIVDVPGKIAFPRIISPRMQPMLHMSTALEYLWEPSRISGARYQRVATYSVRTGAQDRLRGIPSSSVELTVRARPKSASLTKQSALMRRFAGFKSRWIMSPE